MKALVSPTPLLSVQVLPPSPTILPQQQIKFSVAVKCEAPFEIILPDIQIAFLIEGVLQNKLVHVKLPVPLTKFLDPLTLDANTYLSLSF